MSSQTLATMLVLSCLQFLWCEGVEVSVEPPHLRVSSFRTNITVSCRADTAITRCQFAWLDTWNLPVTAGPVLDLSLGQESQADPTHLDQSLLSYAYSGRGLEAGECGVRLEVEGSKVWLLPCRVKSGGSWVYNFTTLVAHDEDPIPHTLEPRQMVGLEGGQARVAMKAEERLHLCHFDLPSWRELHFDEGPMSAHSTGRHLYQGAGLYSGECGLALANLTEEDNGLVRVGIDTGGFDYELRLIPLILARPPTPPTLGVTYNMSDVTATCSVQESRPPPNITWMLGGEVVRQDSEDDSPGSAGDAWRWPWTAGSTSQTLTRRLQPQDTGKRLKCSVSHVALTEPLEVSAVISLRGTSEGTTSATRPSYPANTTPTNTSTTTPHNGHTTAPSTTPTATSTLMHHERHARDTLP